MNSIQGCFSKLKSLGIFPNLVYQNLDDKGRTGVAYYFNIDNKNVAYWFPAFDIQILDTPRLDNTKPENMHIVCNGHWCM